MASLSLAGPVDDRDVPKHTLSPMRRVAARLALAVAVAAALVLLIRAGRSPWLVSAPLNDHADLLELVAALASETTRPIEARLTGGFRHAPPPRGPVRGAFERSVSPDVRIAEARIEKRAEADKTPAARAAMAAAYLALGEPEKAVRALEQSVGERPQESAFANDLAAAYFERWRQKHHAADLAKAVSAAEQALRIRRDLVEAWFNRALVLEALGPASVAREAWQQYLVVDPQSPWGEEARKRLTIAPKTDLTATASLRHVVEESLLDRWADAVTAGDLDRAKSEWTALRRMAESVTAAYGDPYIVDLLDEIAALRDQISAARRIQGFLKARQAVEHNQPEAAQRLLEADSVAATSFSVLALRNAYWQQLIGWYRESPSTLIPHLERLERVCRERGYTYMGGLTYLLHASAFQRLARYGDAVDHYRTAAMLLTSAGETGLVANARMLLASSLSEQGDYAGAWEEEHAALELADAIQSFNERHNVLRGAVRVASRDGLPHMALLFQTLVLREARTRGDSGALFEAARERASIYVQLGLMADAERDLQEAATLFDAIPDPGFRESYRLPLLMTTADVYRLRQPDRAAVAAAEALGYMQTRQSLFLMARAHLTLGRIELSRGHRETALEEWQRGIQVLEDQRPSIRDEQTRISHLSDVWDLYSESIDQLTADPGSTTLGLALAERARARTLLDVLTKTQHADVILPDAARQSLDAQSAIVVYSVIDKRLLAWVLSERDTTFRRTDIDTNDLGRLISRFAVGVERGSPDDEAARRLYQLLIAPIRAALPIGGRIMFVPDGPLWRLPIAALADPSGRYLVEDFEIESSPSLTLFAAATRALAVRSAKRPTRVLVVGNPDFDRLLFPDLSTLAAAAGEAVQVSKQHRSATLLIGEEATRSRVLAELPRHGVLHFAGHAVTVDDFPSRSFLLLAGRGDASRMLAQEISAQRLQDMRLVVLAACSTATGPVWRGEGSLNLARPFLAAGVPLVLGTLWDLPDAETGVLLQFHRAFAQGKRSATALRDAQLAMINTDRRPAASRRWAGYQLIGGLEGAHDAESDRQLQEHVRVRTRN